MRFQELPGLDGRGDELEIPERPPSTAEVIVNTDRTISRESWVAIGPARKASD